MDFDMPSPSQFPSSSQWARACTRPASADMDDGVVRWMASQPSDPALQKLMAESVREEDRERRPRSSAPEYTVAWAPSTSTSSTTRTASLPMFPVSTSSSLPSHASDPFTSTSTSGRKLPPRSKPMSKKLPPSRACAATAPTKDDASRPDPTAGILGLILSDLGNSRQKQIAKAKGAKKTASSSSGDTSMRRSTVSASSSASRFTSAASTARPSTKTVSMSTIPCASTFAPTLGRAIGRTSSSATIKPTIKLSRDSGADMDVEMTIGSDRDTDRESSTSTDSLGNVTFADTLNESFSMHVDDIVPPPVKRTIGRTHSIDTIPSTNRSTISSSNSGFASSSSSKTIAIASSTISASLQNIPQSTHVRAPMSTSTTQRRPPPLGMRRPPNLSNTGFPSSQSRYAPTQSPYVASQTKGQKQVTLPPFKPPLLSKPNSKPVYTQKQVAQNHESPPTSTPELDEDEDEDKDGGSAAVADSSFDVSFDVDVDALEATMRQYD